jgi:tagatose 1,6-diphosphate aldolase
MEMTPGKLWGLRRLATPQGHFAMLATDQRPPIMNLVAAKRGTSATFQDVVDVKVALTRTLAGAASALLVDPVYGYCSAIAHAVPGRGLLVTLEEHEFAETPGGRISREIADWSVAKIKRLGADGVKLLAWYRPDAAEDVRRHQEEFVARVGAACRTHDICFLLELLVYPLPGETQQTADYVEHRDKHPQLVIDSVRAFADPRFGVDLFKLESPVPGATLPDLETGGAATVAAREAFAAIGAIAPRPWVMLSAGVTMAQFSRVLRYAYEAGASGYLAGRAIWWEAAQSFPDLAVVERRLSAEGVPYMDELNRLTQKLATPWHAHRCFADGVHLAGAGPDFRVGYSG